jgi:hypothetical protein
MEITTAFIIAQVFGLLASLTLIASVQFKKKEHILILTIVNSILFTISFIFLEAFSGAAVCALGALISAVIFIVEKLGRRVNWLLIVIFALAELAALVLTFKTPWDVVPIVGTGFWLASLLQRDENRLRWLMMVNFVAWIIYGIVTTAYTSIIADIFSIISTIIALVRYRNKKSAKKRSTLN